MRPQGARYTRWGIRATENEMIWGFSAGLKLPGAAPREDEGEEGYSVTWSRPSSTQLSTEPYGTINLHRTLIQCIKHA